MATIINTPGRSGEDSGAGVIIGVVLAILVIAFLFFAYALPAMRNQGQSTTQPGANVNVTLPAGQNSSQPANK